MLASLCATLLALAAGREAPPEPAHRISIQVAGPVALVDVEREVFIGEQRTVASDKLVELDLPEGAALVDWGARAAKVVKIVATAEATARNDYAATLSSHHLAPARVPADEAGRLRVHLAPLVGRTRVLLRYRYTAPVTCAEGRFVLRLPPSLEENPSPAQVTVRFDNLPAGLKLAEASVAGVPVRVGSNGRAPVVHATAPRHAAWEVGYVLRGQAAEWPAQLAAARAGRRAGAPARAADLLAVGLCRPPRPANHEAPGDVLLLIDRSRSVGAGGMSSQRALARSLLEALPPAERFNAILFARSAKPIFPISRTATREALDAFEAAADPNQLENGTDLAAALARAAVWVNEKTRDAVSRLLVIISDGAVPESQSAGQLAAALAPVVPSDKLRLLVLLVRAAADDRVPVDAVEKLDRLVGRFGGVVRALVADDLRGLARSSLGALAQGGDLFNVRIAGRGGRELAAGVAPGMGLVKVVTVPPGQGSRIQVVGEYAGATVRLITSVVSVANEWLQPLANSKSPVAWAGSSPEVAIHVETVVPRPTLAADGVVRGQMDPQVLRNALALAFLPRARACYLSRRVTNGVDLNLHGRLRLELHLERGELEEAVIRKSSLERPEIEHCIREAAFHVDYPRPMLRDAPTVAALNLVFRPRTPEESRPDASEFEREIDLILGPVTFDPQKLLEDLNDSKESGAAGKAQSN